MSVAVDTAWSTLQSLVAQPTMFLDRIVRLSIEAVNARFGGLVLVLPDGPYVRQIAAVNSPTPVIDARYSREEGLIPRVLQGRPVFVDQYDSQRPPEVLQVLPDLGPVVLWPFTRDGEVYAYVQAASLAGDPPFDRAAITRVGELFKRVSPLLPPVLALRHAQRGLAVHDAAARLLDGLRRLQDIAELSRRAIEGLASALGLGTGAVVLTTPDGGFEIPGRLETVRLGAVERQAIAERQLLIAPGRDTCLALEREVAIVPLSTSDSVLGALVMAQRGAVGHFWPDELRWVERYAVRVAFAVQYLRDRAAQASRIDTYQRLLEGVRLISAEHELDEVLQRLVDVAVTACQARSGAVYMLGPDGTLRRRTLASSDLQREVALPREARRGEGVIGRAFAEGRTLRVSAELEGDGGGAAASVSSSVVATAIRGGDERLGVLTLVGPARGTLSTAATLEHVELVAAHAGTAIVAARRIDALRHAEVDLRRHVVEVEEYAYTVSHDLQGPVVSISGLATLLLEEAGPHLPESAKELVHRIRRAADHLALLSGDLTSYSRLGRQGEEPEDVSLLDAIRGSLRRLALRVDITGMVIEPPATDVALWIARPYLDGIVDHAISNALRYGRGSEPPCLRISWADEGERVVVRFDDNGPGIPEAQRERVFELFRRGDTTLDGTGVGLTSVRRSAELAGGAAWIETSPLGGCSLCVRLPRA